MTRLLRAIRAVIMYPLGPVEHPIDWNARLAATLKPDSRHLTRRGASKRGWQTRRKFQGAAQ